MPATSVSEATASQASVGIGDAPTVAPLSWLPWLDARRARIGGGALLAATVLFNPLLAIVNGHGARMSGGIVAAAQGAIVLAALAAGLLARPLPARWLALAWGLLLAFLGVSLLRGDLPIKNLGDALLIPAFICLGASMDERTLIRTVTGLQIAITVVGGWELLFPRAFGRLFKVLDYYVATRGYDPKLFYAGGDLFVSSERGGGRLLLNFTGWHRGSSLFLEPVSLGNWAVVATLFLAAFWDRMGWWRRAVFASTIAMVLITCDGRLALGVCVLLALWLPVTRFIPARLAVLYLPAMILVLAALRAAGHLPQSGDTLTGRFRGGLDLLGSLDMAQLFGLGALSREAVDAGWVYLIETQSVLVCLALWLVLTLSDTGESASARMMKHGVALFVALCLPISYAILSVKTAAVMWATYGYAFQRRSLQRPSSRSPIAPNRPGDGRTLVTGAMLSRLPLNRART